MRHTTTTPRPDHAVVVGAGLGGLLAARALSRHFERVTLVERDDVPGRPTHRSLVPPSRQVHVLQPGGLAALERLLPGFGPELVASGAVRLVAPRDICWLSAPGWMHPFQENPGGMLSASRDLVEAVTRRLVLDTPQIIVRSGLEVTGLVVAPGSGHGTAGRARAVDVRPRGAARAEPTECIVADLVVDASGGRSRAPDWLAAAGYGRPAERTVDVDLACATRVYRRGRDDLGRWKAVFLQGRPPHTRRLGALLPIERDRWMLTVAGADRDVPPTDEAGFRAFVRGLRAPTLARAIDTLEPLSSIVGYDRTQNRRRHYESLPMPDGFVVVGDAACAVKPFYGQDVSAAALTAEALDRGIDDHLVHGGRVASVTTWAQKAVAQVNAGALMEAMGEPYAPQERQRCAATSRPRQASHR